MTTTHPLLRYYVDQQCSRQWSGFLLSLAQELQSLADEGELRPLMRQVGRRMASQMPLPAADTLEDLQAAINQLWDRLGWGWVSLQERASLIVIEHCAAPLQSAFGSASLAWSPGLLEGIYEQWFRMAGAGEGATVCQSSEVPEEPLMLAFHLTASSPCRGC